MNFNRRKFLKLSAVTASLFAVNKNKAAEIILKAADKFDFLKK